MNMLVSFHLFVGFVCLVCFCGPFGSGVLGVFGRFFVVVFTCLRGGIV